MKVDYSQHGYVYRVTNLVNRKTYVGKHKIVPGELWDSYLGSGRLIVIAVNHYGKGSFRKELLAYGSTPEELDALELRLIQSEIQNNKGEYNIFFGHREEIRAGTLGLLEESPVLAWYFEDKLSTREIAERLGCSQPLVVSYLGILRDTDSRFALVRERVAQRPRKRSEEAISRQRQAFAESLPVVCGLCGNSFKSNVLVRHRASCEKNLSKNHLPDCAVCGVKLSKSTAIHCTKHKRANSASSMMGNTNAAGNSGGKVTAHKRWHVGRNIVSPSCDYCLENSH